MAAVRRHPVAADSVVAVAFSAGALVSLYATFELLRQDPKFHEPVSRMPPSTTTPCPFGKNWPPSVMR